MSRLMEDENFAGKIQGSVQWFYFFWVSEPRERRGSAGGW